MVWLADALGYVTTTVSTLLGSIGADTAGFFTSLAMEVDEASGDITGINPLGGFIFMLLGLMLTLAIVGWVTTLFRNRQ